jgi:tRNA G18 (ribose-2'-O)-methylase SpoU
VSYIKPAGGLLAAYPATVPNPRRELVVVAHNLRSAYNVGALLRTAEVFAVDKVYFTGFTPYPVEPGDTRGPTLTDRLTRKIGKTALGAEHTMTFAHDPHVFGLLGQLREEGFTVTGLEIDPAALSLESFIPPEKTVLVLGEEVSGISDKLLGHCDVLLQIPMFGRKESLNVSVAAGVALYRLRTA